MQKMWIAAFAAVVAAVPAQAVNLVTFTIDWAAQGEDSGGATGTLTVDTDVLPSASQTRTDLPSPAVTAFSMTVSGTPFGDGTFGLGDFNSLIFLTPEPLDLTRELIGQPLGNGCFYGELGEICTGISGDFNLFAQNFVLTSAGFAAQSLGGQSLVTPSGNFFFEITVGDGLSQQFLRVVSIRPESTVPEPVSWALLVAGFTLTGVAVRRRRRAAAA